MGNNAMIMQAEKINHKKFGVGKIVTVKQEGASSWLVTARFFGDGTVRELFYPHPAIEIVEEGTEVKGKGYKLISAVRARTHKDFLNVVFGCNLGGLFTTTWPHSKDPDIDVWMVRFNWDRATDWYNELMERDGVLIARETYRSAGIPITAKISPLRVVVGIEDLDDSQRIYRVYGVFKLSVESTLKVRLWEKLPDDIACKMVPEIFE